MPWGATQVANYTVANGAAAAGGLVNVKFQVWSSNSSKHPVMAPLNKDFPTQARMVAPYNNFTRNGTGGTANWSLGVVINCFDCHNTTGRGLTTRTVAAHGNATGLAGTYFVASPTLCTDCHGTAYATTGAQHGAGSALTTGKSNMSATTFASCHNCHMSNTALPARPVPAFDIHGFNGLLATGGAWTYGNGNTTRPTAFLRNTVRFATVSPRPKQITRTRIGVLASGTANCGGSSPAGCGDNMSQYTPGGTY